MAMTTRRWKKGLAVLILLLRVALGGPRHAEFGPRSELGALLVGAACEPVTGRGYPAAGTPAPEADADVLDVVEICATEDSGAAGIVQVSPDIIVDSGAGASVANQAHLPHCVVEPSSGSENGQTFIGALGASMPNRSEIKPRLILETGGLGTFRFQETTVRKPLLAVSDVNNKGNLVLFDGHESFILQPSDEVEEIRKLVRKASKKIPLHLENGTFKLKAW